LGAGLLLAGCGSNTDVGTIQITPASQSLTAGQTAQFSATGIISHGKHPSTSQNVTTTVTWTSSSADVATISATGLATAVSAGTATITASMAGSAPATATITVTGSAPKPANSLVSLAILPGSQTALAINQTAAFVAIGTTSSGTTVNVTNQSATVGNATIKAAVWSSSIPAIATIDRATGVATALTNGDTTITAVATNPDGTVVTGTATLSVKIPTSGGAGEPLVSLAIVPASQTLTGANQTASFIAIGTTSTGTTVNLTNTSAIAGTATIHAARWSSSVSDVASIDSATGVATGKTNGVTAITAVASNPDGTVVTGIATLTVNISAPGAGEPLVSLAIVPASQTLTGLNQTANFIAIGTTSSGTTVDLTNTPALVGSKTIQAATWGSSSPAVATISAPGAATAIANGATAITAKASNPDGTVVTATAALTVNITSSSEPLVSLAIVPGSQTATVAGQTAQFIAIGTTSTGSTVDLTKQPVIINGQTINAATWASSSKAVATIDSMGLATAVSTGVVAITAQAANPDGTVVTGTATFTVSAKPEPLVSLTITPAAQTLTTTGQTAQFIAIGTTASGATVNLTSTSWKVDSSNTIQPVKWDSSSKAVAGIDKDSGLAVAGTSGTTAITAIAYNPDGTAVTGTATVTVTPSWEPLVSLTITPTSQQALTIHQPMQFIAIATTSTGTTVDLTGKTAQVAGQTISWAEWKSSNEAVATIDKVSGIATTLGSGTTAITAIATNPTDGSVVTGTAALTVTLPGAPEPLVSMAITPSSQTLSVLNQKAYLKAIATTGTGTAVDLTNKAANVAGELIAPAEWASSNPGVADVNPGTGEVTAKTAGVTAITAIATNTNDGTVVTGTATITVTATGGAGGDVISVTVLPGSQTVALPGDTADYMAIGTTTTGATVDLTASPLVTWSSSSAQIATIVKTGPAAGHAIAVAHGTATITALYDPGNTTVVTGTGMFTVVSGTADPYTALTIIPGTQTLSASDPYGAQFIALATVGSSGRQEDVTKSVNLKWDSSLKSLVDIDANGLAKGKSAGSATITAEWKDPADPTKVVSAAAAVTVVLTAPPQPLVSLKLIPSDISIGNLQGTGQFLAIGTFSGAPYVSDVTNSANTTWISSFPDDFPVSTNNAGGTVSASAGIVTAYGTGTATIIAEYKDPASQMIQTATATFSCPLVLPNPPTTAGSCFPGSQGTPLKVTLTVYGEGLNVDPSNSPNPANAPNWLVTAPSATGTPDVIHCGPGWTANVNPGGSVCVGIYPVGQIVYLKAPAQTGVAFGGWTYNCQPVDKDHNPIAGVGSATGDNFCAIELGTTNATVGAIFNNQ
jgi:uncharacterized protein YjdB